MINVDILTGKLIEFLNDEISLISNNHPAIAFFKPLINRILDRNIDKIKTILLMVSDENSNIDIIPLLNDMTKSLINTKPFKIDSGVIGDIEIGNGVIKFNIPLIDKTISLNIDDIEKFKQMITT